MSAIPDYQRRAADLLERGEANPSQQAWLIALSERTRTLRRQHFDYLSALECRVASEDPPLIDGGGWG